MAERAHPDDPGFQEREKTVRVLKFFKVKRKEPNEYRDAVFWRYSLIQEVCNGLDVLDVPCGMGWGTSMLRGCKSLQGLDISEEAIEEARRRYGHLASFDVGSMATLPFADRSFDLVSCLEGIEHVSKDIGRLFLAEASRVLRSSGRLIVSSPHCNNAPHSGNPYHVYEYPPEEMSALLQSSFVIENTTSREVDNLTITVFFSRKP
jgi:ubiquinone/menaquinone biosynthesis C-methylase UbiE